MMTKQWAIAALAVSSAVAQTPPAPKPAPEPPVPALAPAPMAKPPLPPLPPGPPPLAAVQAELDAKRAAIEAFAWAAKPEAVSAEIEAKVAAAHARALAAGVRMEAMAPSMEMLYAKIAGMAPFAQAATAGVADREKMASARERDRAERAYRDGRSRLDRRQYAEAVGSFDDVIAANSPRKDGAHYWKAYALSKLGRMDEALASLKQIPADSRWQGDSKALEVEVRQASGRPVSPENQSDEELKLFALNALVDSDPERVLPILERQLKSSSSPRMKERALFVLAQMQSAKAREVLLQVARGGGNPDLQLKAVEYLGVHSPSPESRNALAQIYSSTNDHSIKMAVLRGYLQANDKARVLAVAKADGSTEMRRYALQMLAGMDAENEIWQIYQSETNPELKQMAVQMLGSTGATQRLLEVARTEKDGSVRLRAIQMLGGQRGQEEALAAIYGSEQDTKVRRQVLYALRSQDAAKQIVAIARKETDPELKRTAVQMLAGMKSPEASEYLMELLK
ncbi:MAG: HEAT repeat domain-containing protein [Bryobacteraceae bacterium]|nr:HEAT repeat domain-containing protein [Bryobacteraceae bacterium]